MKVATQSAYKPFVAGKLVGTVKVISMPSRRSHASKDSVRAGEGA
jgi:hypothetical protein